MKKYLSIINDFGIKWSFNRGLYALKLKFLNLFPFADIIFERRITIEKIDLFDIEVEELELFLLDLKDVDQQKIIMKADDAIEGRLLIFSSHILNYGKPINWFINPLTGQTHPKNKKWFSIPDFDENVGDIKVIWEASRLTHFLDFSRAYMLTKDIKYYKAFVGQLTSWLHENQYSYGPNYKCGQEATIRMINVLLSYTIFDSYGLVTKEDKMLVKELVENSYKKIESNFFYAHKCIQNNHTFTEILGKIIGAWCENDSKRLKYSVDLMNKEIRKQFTDDGGFKQYSNNYHRFTLQIFEVLLSIEDKIGHVITEKEIINSSVVLLYNVMNSDGRVPNYGSNDGALIFPLSVSKYEDYRPTINTVFAQLNNQKLFEDGVYTEELLWFHQDVEKVVEKEKRAMGLFEFGLYSFRDEDSLLVTYLNNYTSRPAHMDQLHIDFWYKDVEVFIDLGTYSYASNLGYQLSLNSNHNTLAVPGVCQMNKVGAFMVYDWSVSKLEGYIFNRKFDGVLRSGNGYSHKRSIERMDYGYRIIDESDSEEFFLTFNTPLKIYILDDRLSLHDDEGLLVSMIVEGNVNIEHQYQSTYYLHKRKINQIKINNTGRSRLITKIILERND